MKDPNKNLFNELERAYGRSGLGAISISGIPQFPELRKKLLPLSYKLAHLDEESKKRLEHPESMYNAGWSHGKEKMGDEPDYAKGSFYANPLFDKAADDEVIKKYPYFYPVNIWPKEIPEIEIYFKQLGSVMFNTVVLLCDKIDNLISSRVPSFQRGSLINEMRNTKKVKGRLLYYYPTDSNAEDGWIAAHNDSGIFTALNSDLFYDDLTGKEIENPDPYGGLWIIDRNGGQKKVNIPKDDMAVQIGECLQIISGGLLVATPHQVKPSKQEGKKIGRASFPVFVDTDIHYKLSAPPGVPRESVFDHTIDSRVPPLHLRWRENGVSFVDFLGEIGRASCRERV